MKKNKNDNNEEKPKRSRRPHSEQTKLLISERRRSREVQPRNISQSKRRKSFYDELSHEYEKIGKKKLTEKQKQKLEEAKAWIKENKIELGHVEGANDFRLLEPYYEKYGILTEYREMYFDTYETRVGSILYSDELTPTNDLSNNPFDIVSNAENSAEINEDYNELFANTGGLDE